MINRVKLYLNGNIYQKTLSWNLVFKGTEKKTIDMLQNTNESENKNIETIKIIESWSTWWYFELFIAKKIIT